MEQAPGKARYERCLFFYGLAEVDLSYHQMKDDRVAIFCNTTDKS